MHRSRHHAGQSIALIITLVAALLAPAWALAANTAPVISGTPPTAVAVGKAYYFKPTASDANGDTLRFSIQNKPSWAIFESKTGVLRGTPKSHNVGKYPNIRITVERRPRDGQLAAVHDHGDLELIVDEQSCSDHQRHACYLGRRGAVLQLPADGVGRRRRYARLHDPEQAVVGDFQRDDGSSVRHACDRPAPLGTSSSA